MVPFILHRKEKIHEREYREYRQRMSNYAKEMGEQIMAEMERDEQDPSHDLH
jgi:hypothetical protein